MLSAETAELLADGVTADEEAIPAEGQKEHAWHAHLGLGWRADVSSRDSSWAVAGSYAERAARRAELGRARTTRSRGCQRRGRTTRSKPDAPRRQPCATCSPVGEPVGAVAAGAEMATAAAAAAAAATASTAAEVVEVERGRRRLRAGACRRGRGRPQRQRLARCGAPMGHGMGCLNDVPRAGLDWQVACGRLLTALVPHSLSPQLKDAGSALGAGDGRGDPADYRRPASAGHGHVSPEIDEQGGRLAPLSYPYEGDPL